MTYENIRVETRGRVGTITLNRPAVLNTINADTMRELIEAAETFDSDSSIGCIVVTGSARAFAAGADINEVRDKSFIDMHRVDPFSSWDRLAAVRTPLVAAVSGFALGGGCELAMMCDIILASDTAKFGQPEIKLGVIPGVGGTQRLARAVGKPKAMELCLTGRIMDADEALACGLIARVVPAARLEEEAFKLAETIASMSLPSAVMVKEAVNRAFETSLSEGLRFERRLFQSIFATADQKEGMTAFAEKRPPRFDHK